MKLQLLVLSFTVSVVALVYARFEYRRLRKLSLFGLLLLCAMLFVPNVLLHYEMSFAMPSTPAGYVGAMIGFAGLALCFYGIVAFRSIAKVLCLDAGKLTDVGPYRFSRNPQYVGWVLFLLGCALNGFSMWSAAAVLVVAVSLHLLVLVEEEHLGRVFGEAYGEFRRKTPRYLGWAAPR